MYIQMKFIPLHHEAIGASRAIVTANFHKYFVHHKASQIDNFENSGVIHQGINFHIPVMNPCHE